MIKNTLIILSIFLLLIFILVLRLSFAQAKPPAQTNNTKHIIEEVVIENGMFRITYDEDGDGEPDLVTLSRPDGMSGFNKFPLFYIRIKATTGQALTIRDLEEDGFNGNESIYNRNCGSSSTRCNK